MPKVQQYRRQTVQKTNVPKNQIPKPPEMPTEPGKQDKICNAIFVGGLTLGVATLLGSCYALSQGFVQALHHNPVEWLTIVGLVVLSVLLGFVLRGIIWASFVGTTMIASQLKAFHSQEKISNFALKYRKFFPGDTAWAAQAKLGLMANRQQYKEIIVFGTQEYDNSKKKDQSLAPLCAYMGMAHQIQSDPHSAILWNERAIELFEKAMEPLAKVTPEAKVPNRDMVDNMIMQYASAYANLGSNYFSVNNYGKAKKNFNLALEQLNRVKSNPQKDMLIRGINEHLSRIKHW
ncbi:MAG: tetratricopeptide repeat protein [Candidatus Obscuribacterales bacterium]|nr:tetratricopeptide repeat protein [Candidatus Obscuribacterales bacterium]